MNHENPDHDDIHRVYRPEWLIVASLFAGDYPDLNVEQLLDEAFYFVHQYYRDQSVVEARVEILGTGARTIIRARLRLPTMKAEWKTRELAERYVQQQGWDDAVIVARNSREDNELRALGARRLPDRQRDGDTAQ